MTATSGRRPARARQELCVIRVGDKELCVYPLDELLDALAKKWVILLVSVLGNQRAARFSELQRELTGISSRTLTDRLRDLERTGIVRREVVACTPVEVRYSLTKRGQELRESLVPLLSWTATPP